MLTKLSVHNFHDESGKRQRGGLKGVSTWLEIISNHHKSFPITGKSCDNAYHSPAAPAPLCGGGQRPLALYGWVGIEHTIYDDRNSFMMIGNDFPPGAYPIKPSLPL